ncbi:MAG: transcriptional repressor LexA [Peptococcaceae bacterium]|nr:transcriptional repressor LexA [Peptococcaceae bacterium]
MEKQLTYREAAIIDFIKNNVRSKGYPPSVREIGQAVGLKSSSTVHGYLKRLEEKGYIRRDPTKPRAVELIGGPGRAVDSDVKVVPVLGRVAAGQPILAEENHDFALPLPASFFGDGEFFMLKVRGDSMIDAGIYEGDLVLVRQQPIANNGDIVVAMMENEATVKRFFKENAHIRLQPENRTLEPIITRDVSILGKVVGLVRRY